MGKDNGGKTKKSLFGGVRHSLRAQIGLIVLLSYLTPVVLLGVFTGSFLMKRLAESIDTTDVYFQEQTLLASLWTKDVDQFWYHFNDYVRLHPNARIPRFYQEAAYLYCMIEGRPTDRMPFDESVKQSFENFAKVAELYNDVDVEVARKALQAYRHSYYYDYYLMRQLPEY